MAQTYFPATRSVSPVEIVPALDMSAEKQIKVEDIQEAYVEHKDRLISAIDASKTILEDLRSFNKKEWVVRYPHFHEQKIHKTESDKRPSARRSLTFADDPSIQTDIVLSHAKPGISRSLTLAPIGNNTEEQQAEEDIPSSDFNVLRLDLKLGTHGSSNSPTSLVSQLEKSSIAHLLDERFGASIGHMDKLRFRVEDTSSKVLVTGDLNAGKSTFVNALLRREVMPVDQQPCTTAFCEVHDAAENKGTEEVHVLKAGVTYDLTDESTFDRGAIADLEEIVGENEHSDKMLKLYLADTRAPAESLLNNGVVDISLIDAPGLNRDSIKTTALFARQEEIDVVVFVVSAENHFTLSAKEFLWNASNEKAYLFIVVNKYDQIKNKEKCKRMVLEQIKQLSPRTYQNADDLVHFVDSATALQPYTASPAFDDLESSLRSFILVKRSKSKLQPVATYLSNLLSDVELLAGSNAIVASTELAKAMEDLERARPVLEKMKSGRDALEEGLESVEEEGVQNVGVRAKTLLSDALERIGQGKLGVDNSVIAMPSYPGLLRVWDYARDVRRALLASLDAAVQLAEDEARTVTSSGVVQIKTLGDAHLPANVERNRRVFMPEAMFSTIRGKSGKGRAVVAGGTLGLGIGLATRSELLETSFLDLFDAQYQFWLRFGDGKTDELSNEADSAPSALSVLSVGAGALTMVGGQAIGARGLIEGIVRLTEFFSNDTARKWAAPVLGAVTIGGIAYIIMELPNSIPKTVGRRLRVSLVNAEETDQEADVFVNSNVRRISRETRKVLRIASWDLREQFRTAMDGSAKEVQSAEKLERTSKRAQDWFTQIRNRTEAVRTTGQLDAEF